VKGVFRMRTIWPIGSSVPNKRSPAIAPIIATLGAVRSSSAENTGPAVRFHSRMAKWLVEVPLMFVDQFRLFATAWTFPRTPGATNATLSRCPIASASSIVRLWRLSLAPLTPFFFFGRPGVDKDHVRAKGADLVRHFRLRASADRGHIDYASNANHDTEKRQ
jgi:hypothetical protein